MGRAQDAEASYLQALQIKRASLGEHPETARTLNSLGLIAVGRSSGAEARQRYQAALSIFVAAEHGDEALVFLNLALLDIEEEDFDSALEHLSRALELDEARFGQESRPVAYDWIARGVALTGAHLGGARDAFRRGLQIAHAIDDAEMIAKAEAGLSAARPEASMVEHPNLPNATMRPATMSITPAGSARVRRRSFLELT